MKFIKIFLLVLIVVGLGLLTIQKIWVPKLVQKIISYENKTQVKNAESPLVTKTSPKKIKNNRGAPYPAGATGYAISYPQCNKIYPAIPFDFGILGVTRGHSLSPNPCFKKELEWANKAKYAPSFYINLDFPPNIKESLIQSFGCVLNDQKCMAYHYGYHIAKYAHTYAVSQGAVLGTWWLDIQIISKWSLDQNINAQVVLGAIDYFKKQNILTGLSTTPYQWNQIVGSLKTDMPNWIPGRTNKKVAMKYCLNGKNYSNGSVEQLAYIENGFEAIYACGK